MVDHTSVIALGGAGVTRPPAADAGDRAGRVSWGRWLVSRERDRRRERVVGTVLMAVAVVLAGWTVYLGTSDAPRQLHRWSVWAYLGMNPHTLAWVGIDAAETVALALIGILLRQGRPATRTVALLTLPLFVLDAWFDILTSVTPHRLALAITMAALSEVPAAVVCGWVAWKASRFGLTPTSPLLKTGGSRQQPHPRWG